MYVCVYVCVSVRVCVRAVRECVCVRSCVCVCILSSKPFFSAYAHAHAKMGGGRERKNTSGETCQVFVAACYARNVFHVYIN